ncbi:signal transduction histidine kinase [Oleiphilus messinensis]|uniref:histidine kinase n=2 Tax=Oleiphilus messinensis TaxID=141451 RepID=A0A1Y0IAE5_9GAMM|nr:signal transduction histidine kinase [Oleiphilus messinensis]
MLVNELIQKTEQSKLQFEYPYTLSKQEIAKLDAVIRQNGLPPPEEMIDLPPGGLKLISFKIFDAHNSLLFYYPSPVSNADLDYTFPFQSASGQHYRIATFSTPPSPFLSKLFKRAASIQAGLLVLATLLLSLTLTWLITKPLIQLGELGRRYLKLEKYDQEPLKLLARRDEIGALGREIAHLIKTVEEQKQKKQEILNDMLHEIRTPLSRLRMATSLFEQDPTSELDEFLVRIYQEFERMETLTQQILEQSRVEAAEIQSEFLDVNKFLRELLRDVQFEFQQASIDASFPDTPQIITATNRELLRRATENLLRNACKYSPRHESVFVGITNHDFYIRICIDNAGKGISTQDIEKLMTPFYRLSISRFESGFGLGLDIAKRAIEFNNGRLTLEKSSRGGLLTKLDLPAISPNYTPAFSTRQQRDERTGHESITADFRKADNLR